MIQDNYEGTYEKGHYPHAEEELPEWKHRSKKNCLNTWLHGDTIGDVDTNNHPGTTLSNMEIGLDQ